MRIAILSDLHGNLAALEAVLADLDAEQVDHIVCLGDVAMGGPHPREVMARLKALNCPVVMGNTDAWLLNPQPIRAWRGDSQRITEIGFWSAAQLALADLDYVHTFQPTVEVRLADHVGLLCFHGSPRSNADIIVSTTPDAELECMLTGYYAQVLAGGHTHTQMLRRYKDMIIVNPGSVGHTFEFTPGLPEARIPPWTEYALVGWADDRLDVELRRVPIDVNALVRAALSSGMPHAEWWVENWG